MDREIRGNGIDFIKLVLLVFAGFGMDMLLPIFNFTFNQRCMRTISISIIWGVVGYLLLRRAKSKFNFNPFENKEKPDLKGIIMALILLIICIGASYVIWGYAFKPIEEFNRMYEIFGSSAVVPFILQYIYYMFESSLIVLTIIFGQKAGELIWNNKNIPWGGIFLALTWGVMHTFSKDMSTGIWAFSSAIVYGIVFLLMKKNVKYSYVFIFLMFAL